MKKIENISIFRGGAAGTAMGYAIALHFGFIAGFCAGIITAVIVCNPMQFFRAQKLVRENAADLGEGIAADLRRIKESNTKKILWLTNIVKTILSMELIAVCATPAYLVWNTYATIPSKDNKCLTTIIFLLLTLVIEIIGINFIEYSHSARCLNKTLKSRSPLSWPIRKSIVKTQKFLAGIFKKPIMANYGMAKNLFNPFVQSISEALELKNRKETEYDFRIVLFFSGFFILFSCVLVVMPSRWVLMPIGIVVAVDILLWIMDMILMVLLRCVTTATMAAAIGAAAAIVIEWRMYPHFHSGIIGDWLRFGIFMVLGGMSGCSIYMLRKHLLDSENGRYCLASY